MTVNIFLVIPKNLCGVPVDVLGGCAGKDMINGSSNPQNNSTAINRNAAAHPSQYNACIEGIFNIIFLISIRLYFVLLTYSLNIVMRCIVIFKRNC